MIAEKPLKPKLDLSEFSITRVLREMNYNTYFIIGEKNFADFKCKNSKIAKRLFRQHFNEKILTIKKIKF